MGMSDRIVMNSSEVNLEDDISEEHSIDFTDKGYKWYVVKVLSGREEQVASVLNSVMKRQGHDWFQEAFVPIEHISKIHKGKQEVVKRFIWPGYIVVNIIFSHDARKSIRSVRGIWDFIGGAGAVPLSDEETQDVLALKEQGESGKINADPLQFKPGDKVIVSWGDGMGDGNVAKVLDVYSNKGGDKILVEIFAFGREVKMEVDAARVELDDSGEN